MRSFFIAVVFVAMCGCAKSSYVTPLPPADVVVDTYLDLRAPIYIVVEPSFWSGCKLDPAGDEVCRNLRFKQFSDGVNQWFGYFEKATRPQVVFVNSTAELPLERVNPIIRLRIKSDACLYDNGKRYHEACFYAVNSYSSYIAFRSSAHIFPGLAAHELGHALDRNHDDMPTGATSIMLPVVEREARVLLRDIDLLCKIHAECPPHRVR